MSEFYLAPAAHAVVFSKNIKNFLELGKKSADYLYI